MSIRENEYKLTPSARIVMFEVDATSLGGEIYRFIPEVSEGGQAAVVWQGNTYSPFPVKAEGFEWTGVGSLPRPTLAVANITGFITALCLDFDDLAGAKVTRKVTLVKYLDAVNFAGGNPTADSSAYWPDEIYFVDRKALENKNQVNFELNSSIDVQGTKLPRRFVIQNTCLWTYRGAECSYAGGAVAKIDDTPTGDINLDVCGKRLASCKLRFGAEAELPFGAFPGVGLIRV